MDSDSASPANPDLPAVPQPSQKPPDGKASSRHVRDTIAEMPQSMRDRLGIKATTLAEYKATNDMLEGMMLVFAKVGLGGVLLIIIASVGHIIRGGEVWVGLRGVAVAGAIGTLLVLAMKGLSYRRQWGRILTILLLAIFIVISVVIPKSNASGIIVALGMIGIAGAWIFWLATHPREFR